jgi:hypothetical protein
MRACRLGSDPANVMASSRLDRGRINVHPIGPTAWFVQGAYSNLPGSVTEYKIVAVG